MSRKARLASETCIYHVMLRGINKQVIFESDNDFWKFIRLLDRLCHPCDNDGNPEQTHCLLFAYCLMPNHVHLLIKDLDGSLSSSIKSLTISCAQHYNKKYNRVGHLFQDRFRSEPVNDWDYFVTLLRYIHQNPVAAGMVSAVKEYTWSSWREYISSDKCVIPVCATHSVLSKLPINELTILVDTPLPKTQRMLDFDNDTAFRITDEKVREFIISICGEDYIRKIDGYTDVMKTSLIREIRQYGGSLRQISRITGLSDGFVRKHQ